MAELPNAPTKPTTPAPLALRPKDAAKALGIGQRKLWELTKAGAIPHLKIGVCTVYPVAQLQAWLAEQAAGAVRCGAAELGTPPKPPTAASGREGGAA